MNWKIDEDKLWFKKWWPKDCPKNLQFNEITCGDFFEEQRSKYHDEIFMVFLETEMTYDEAGDYIDSLATALHRLGLRKGDVLALLIPNCFQYVITFYACMKIGVIVVPINPNFKKIQILRILKLTQPTTIVTVNYL
ncbi:MAG: AMP-binding protein [Promethearchaeota archaeon]